MPVFEVIYQNTSRLWTSFVFSLWMIDKREKWWNMWSRMKWPKKGQEKYSHSLQLPTLYYEWKIKLFCNDNLGKEEWVPFPDLLCLKTIFLCCGSGILVIYAILLVAAAGCFYDILPPSTEFAPKFLWLLASGFYLVFLEGFLWIKSVSFLLNNHENKYKFNTLSYSPH